MRFLSLFAGIGGFDLGLERAGHTCVGQVEISPWCRKLLARHWPHVWRHDDVRTTTKEIVDANCGTIDFICGGFPCQDISRAGKQAGIGGGRSGLWAEFFRIICELRPANAIVENVSALLDGGMERVLGDLAAGGYDAEWDCLPASAFGAYHERDRVFILAHRQGFDVNPRNCMVQSGERRSSLQSGRFYRLALAARGKHPHARLECEPGLARLVDGIPYRMERLSGLGNAVDPRVAEYVGRLLPVSPVKAGVN